MTPPSERTAVANQIGVTSTAAHTFLKECEENAIVIKPKYTNAEAAPRLGCAPSTLKASRVSGLLFGQPAPPYQKIGRRVLYDHDVLEAWLNQFDKHTNTSQYSDAI